jgi:hypothetical protein
MKSLEDGMIGEEWLAMYETFYSEALKKGRKVGGDLETSGFFRGLAEQDNRVAPNASLNLLLPPILFQA